MADRIDYAAVFDALPTPLLLLDTELRIVALNPARESATGVRREDVVGRPLFEAHPVDPPGDGPTNLEASLRRVLASGQVDVMPVQRYDLLDRDGGFRERWWSPVNAPVLDESGNVVFLLHRVEDVTEYVRERETASEGPDPAEADVWVRAHELREALTAEASASARLAALVQVAGQIANVSSMVELTDLVFERGLALLGADAGAVGVLEPDGEAIRATVTNSLSHTELAAVHRVPLERRLPAAFATASGQELLLHDRAEALAWGAEMRLVVEGTGLQAWAAFPLVVDGSPIGAVSVGWRDPQPFTDRDRDLARAFAGLCAQGLARLRAHERERELAAAERELAATLQRSLLTAPMEPDHLAIAVRYRPAFAGVQVGGDWYDAFITDGSTTLVIGDVAGHDRDATAHMAQLRNVLRGVAVSGHAAPAAALSALDTALRTLRVGALATAVVARVEQPAELADQGLRLLRWSNAGHAPPVLLPPDGPARLLEAPVDLMLGVDADSPRQDHTVCLAPDATVVLYTDGLVERRERSLQEGLDRLLATVEGARGAPPEELCDVLLADAGEAHDDDIALLVLRAYPEDRPRPAEAGPSTPVDGDVPL